MSGQSSYISVSVQPSYLNKDTISRLWPYDLNPSAAPYHDSSSASLLRFCSAPLNQRAVVEFFWLSSVQGTDMSQLGQQGRGWFPSSMITIVSCTWRCTQCTHRLALIVAPLKPSTGNDTVPAAHIKETLYSNVGYGASSQCGSLTHPCCI